MQRKKGIHFYINIANLNDVIADEESKTKRVNHAIHALDTFFSAIESFGKKYFESFVVEKITGSRLHMYVEGTDINKTFVVVSEVSKFAYKLTSYINKDISKYKTLKNFRIQIGACYGEFYSFEFTGEDINEETTIGYAANYAAKLQGLALPAYIAISSNIYETLADSDNFEKCKDGRIKKYDQEYFAVALISTLDSKIDLSKELAEIKEKANILNLSDIVFTKATRELAFSGLSRKDVKEFDGIPFFSDVRGFTSQFEEDDSNLEEMAKRTQNILSLMYGVVRKNHGVHIQFQGDREFAVFHNYSNYDCVVDAVQTGLRMIDGVHSYCVSVGIGESFGRLFATKIGARGEKDNILIGTTVTQADKFEDELANENQLVVSKEIFEMLQKQKPRWAKYFTKVDDNCFRITIGYNELLSLISKEQLIVNNEQNNYNKAWGGDGFDSAQKKQYVSNVLSDFAELKEEYPFSSMIMFPYSKIHELNIEVIAVNKNFINEMSAEESDFTGEFSKKILVKVPFDYRNSGCTIYGGKWIEYDSLKSDEDRHFYKGNENGYEFCLGVPESFSKMKNVILECVRTADNMLVAYEQVQRHPNMKLQLNSYSHGREGINEYRTDRRKYVSE